MNIHLRYAGQSRTLSTPLPNSSTSEQVLDHLQRQGLLPYPLPELMVDRQPDGVVVRPAAVFG
jgi:hypothetical protein